MEHIRSQQCGLDPGGSQPDHRQGGRRPGVGSAYRFGRAGRRHGAAERAQVKHPAPINEQAAQGRLFFRLIALLDIAVIRWRRSRSPPIVGGNDQGRAFAAPHYSFVRLPDVVLLPVLPVDPLDPLVDDEPKVRCEPAPPPSEPAVPYRDESFSPADRRTLFWTSLTPGTLSAMSSSV